MAKLGNLLKIMLKISVQSGRIFNSVDAYSLFSLYNIETESFWSWKLSPKKIIYLGIYLNIGFHAFFPQLSNLESPNCWGSKLKLMNWEPWKLCKLNYCSHFIFAFYRNNNTNFKIESCIKRAFECQKEWCFKSFQ